MDDKSRVSFKVLIGILLVALGILIGILWGEFHPKTLPFQRIMYSTKTHTPHMSSLFQHPHRPIKHTTLINMTHDMQQAFHALEKASQDFSAGSLNSMQHLMHHHINPIAVLKDFIGASDSRYPQNILIVRPGQRGQAEVYRIDALDAF